MKIYLSIIFALAISFSSLFGANAINITANDTYPDKGGNDYWSVTEGKKYGFSIKGTFVTASLDIQEAYVDEATGGEVWGSIATKSAITAVEDYQFVALGNKVRIVVTLESTDDIDVIGPVPIED